jgi:predicted Zn-dependent protease
VGLGKLLEILEQHTEAVVAYRRAAQHDPTLVDAHVCLASLLRRLDDPRAAVLTLRAAAARLPGSGPMSLELAEALLAVHQPDEAIMHAERARERSMPEEAVLRVFARARAVLGQLDAALAALRTLPELTEDDVEVAVSVARAMGSEKTTSRAETTRTLVAPAAGLVATTNGARGPTSTSNVKALVAEASSPVARPVSLLGGRSPSTRTVPGRPRSA